MHIFLSHYHWDHIVGMLTFAPLFDKSFEFNIYGFNKFTKIENLQNKLLDSAVWPVSMDMLSAEVNFIELSKNSMKISDNIIIDYIHHTHPNGATSYKINISDFSILYTTDCEHTDNILNQEVVEIAKSVNILIHDSHFTREDLPKHKGWGHSSWENAVELAKVANVNKLILFHFNPEYSDETVSRIEQKAKKNFTNTVAAKQGMKVNF